MRGKRSYRKFSVVLTVVLVLILGVLFLDKSLLKSLLGNGNLNFEVKPVKAAGTSFAIWNANPSNAGYPLRSGMRIADNDPPGQNPRVDGHDSNNPIDVLLTASPVAPDVGIRDFYIAFYFGSSRLITASSFIGDVQGLIIRPGWENNYGFLLHYKPSTGVFEVFRGNPTAWVNVSSYTPTSPYVISGCDGFGINYCYSVSPIPANSNGSQVQWRIWFSRNLPINVPNGTPGLNSQRVDFYNGTYVIDDEGGGVPGNIQFNSNP